MKPDRCEGCGQRGKKNYSSGDEQPLDRKPKTEEPREDKQVRPTSLGKVALVSRLHDLAT